MNVRERAAMEEWARYEGPAAKEIVPFTAGYICGHADGLAESKARIAEFEAEVSRLTVPEPFCNFVGARTAAFTAYCAECQRTFNQGWNEAMRRMLRGEERRDG